VLSLLAVRARDRGIVVWFSLVFGLCATLLTIAELTILE
jgi:hypothetical protein